MAGWENEDFLCARVRHINFHTPLVGRSSIFCEPTKHGAQSHVSTIEWSTSKNDEVPAPPVAGRFIFKDG